MSRAARSIVAASSGNLVEWFDFYAYSFTSLYFAAAFFPQGDATSQLLNTAGIFGLGFFMRPLGSWLFGRIADTRESSIRARPESRVCVTPIGTAIPRRLVDSEHA